MSLGFVISRRAVLANERDYSIAACYERLSKINSVGILNKGSSKLLFVHYFTITLVDMAL